MKNSLVHKDYQYDQKIYPITPHRKFHILIS